MRVEDVNSYELIEKKELSDINSMGYLLRHRKTGARVVLVSNDDDNKVFNIGFRTTPFDSTGVPHIMEHSVLCGSKNFPLKDPFVELVKGSLNTFLNAMTYPDKTIYPVASCNAKDFQNLMHVYLDAVFYPNIYEKEEIFRQEGWHYEIDEEGKLTYNGVVYNEMKGALSSIDSILWREVPNLLYPDTTYGVESGGDPVNIPELTYEQFKDFHRKYYHPSNSYIYLYGDMDMAEKLIFIDEEYLSRFEYLEVDSQIVSQKPFTEPVHHVKEVSISEGESEEDNTFLIQAFSMDDHYDRELYLTLKILDFALCSVPGAPVKQALVDKGLGKDIYSIYENGIKQPFFGFVAKGTTPDKEEAFREALREKLEDLVKNGIGEKALISAIQNMEFKYREADFGTTPKGLMFLINMFDSWLYDDADPFANVEQNETFRILKERVKEGYFEQFIDKYLLHNNHGINLVLKPVAGLAKQQEEELEKKLADIKAKMSDEEIEAVKAMMKRLEDFRETEDKPEDIARIPLLSREDLKREAATIYNEEKMLGDTFALYHNIFTNGIGHLRIIFKLPEISNEYLPALSVLKSLYMNVSTENYSYGDFCNEVNLITGGVFVAQNNYGSEVEQDKITSTMEVCTRALYENLPRAIELMDEMIFTSKIDDKKRIRELLLEGISKQREYMGQAGHIVAIGRAMSYGSRKDALEEELNGMEFYRFCLDLEAHFEEKIDGLIAQMKELCKIIYRPENLMIDFIGDEEELFKLEKEIAPLKAKLYTEQVESGKQVLVPTVKNEGFTSSGQVDYVCRAGNFRKKGLDYTGALVVLRVMLGYEYLWTNIRVKGGAYGCMCNFYRDGGSYFCSYRDPNLSQTIDVYEKAAEFIENYEADERTMTQYIIGAISELDTPLTAAGKGIRSRGFYFAGITPEMLQQSRNEILDAEPEQIRGLAEYIRAFMQDGYLCVVGNEQMIRAEEKLFMHIENLF